VPSQRLVHLGDFNVLPSMDLPGYPHGYPMSLKTSPFLLKADATPCSRSETQHDVPSWKRFTTEFYARLEAAKSSRPRASREALTAIGRFDCPTSGVEDERIKDDGEDPLPLLGDARRSASL